MEIKIIEQVNRCKYLEIIFTNKQSSEQEIKPTIKPTIKLGVWDF